MGSSSPASRSSGGRSTTRSTSRRPAASSRPRSGRPVRPAPLELRRVPRLVRRLLADLRPGAAEGAQRRGRPRRPHRHPRRVRRRRLAPGARPEARHRDRDAADPADAVEREALAAEAEAFGRFFGLPADLRVVDGMIERPTDPATTERVRALRDRPRRNRGAAQPRRGGLVRRRPAVRDDVRPSPRRSSGRLARRPGRPPGEPRRDRPGAILPAAVRRPSRLGRRLPRRPERRLGRAGVLVADAHATIAEAGRRR